MALVQDMHLRLIHSDSEDKDTRSLNLEDIRPSRNTRDAPPKPAENDELDGFIPFRPFIALVVRQKKKI